MDMQCCDKIEIRLAKEKDIFLGGPKEVSFSVNDFNLVVYEIGYRRIIISSVCSKNVKDFWSVFNDLQKLLMIFYGHFLDVKEIEFFDANDNILSNSENLKNEYLNTRIKYFKSRKEFFYKDNILLTCDLLSKDLFKKWQDLTNELDIVHQIILYYCADLGMPIDGAVANIIESFEPLIELISEKTNLFTSLKPGEHGTTLKMCLDAVISYFGKDIFFDEYNQNCEKFLQILVNSRIKIAHIKRKCNRKEPCFDGEESVFYTIKLMLLYRHILLNLLGVDYNLYSNNIKNYVEKLNSQDIYIDFVGKKLKNNQ